MMTTTTGHSAANRTRVEQAEAAWSAVLRAALVRGFHGTACVEVAVQDGTIQHVRRRVEQLEK